EKERSYYESLPNKRRTLEFLAGRFAAKEAFAKATGRGIGKLSFQDIEILNKTNGAPEMKVHDYEGNIFVSISHSEAYAVAQVVLT
ncbi:MAG TPA: holo-ACP synthase, partial [Savagea sp.]